MGVSWIVREPGVLLAIDPTRALGLLTQHKIGALAVLAGVFLCVTGGEALYADMGHFGKAPIRLGWICIVMPALVDELFRPGCAADRKSGGHQQSLLHDGALRGRCGPW